ETRLHDYFEKVRLKRTDLRQIQDRMDHPLRVARLLEIGEAEVPAQILRVDHVTHAERQRLAPHHDLITDEGRQRAGLVLPPEIAHLVVVVKIVSEMAEARRDFAPRWTARARP